MLFNLKIGFIAIILFSGNIFFGFSAPGYQDSQRQSTGLSADSVFNSLYKQYYLLTDLDSMELAESVLQMAMDRAYSITDTSAILLGLQLKADNYLNQGLFMESIVIDYQRITLSDELNNIDQKAATFRHLQYNYRQLNMVDSAIYYCDLEMKINRTHQRFYQLSQSYSCMHDLLRWSLGHTSEQSFMLVNLIDSALSLAYLSGDKQLINEMLIANGKYVCNYNHDLGLAYFNQVIDSVREDKPVNPFYFEGLYNRGLLHYSNARYNLAEEDYLLCLNLVNSNEHLSGYRNSIYCQLGYLYHRTGQFRKAIDYLNMAYQLAIFKDDPYLAGIYSVLAQLYGETGQNDSCIIILNKHVTELYKMFNNNSAQQIAVSGARFQLAEHQNMIKGLDYKNQRQQIRNKAQRRFIILLASSILLICILLAFLYGQYQKTRFAYLRIHDKNARISQQEEEITILREQKLDKLTGRFEHDLELLESLMKDDKIFVRADLKLGTVAKMLKINHNYLSGIINRHFGCNFTTYLNQYRIVEATRLLDEGILDKYSIEAISKMVGYQSKSAFYRAFREQKGSTPTEYLDLRK
jgi:AraC-like DNA-binding protein